MDALRAEFLPGGERACRGQVLVDEPARGSLREVLHRPLVSAAVVPGSLPAHAKRMETWHGSMTGCGQQNHGSLLAHSQVLEDDKVVELPRLFIW